MALNVELVKRLIAEASIYTSLARVFRGDIESVFNGTVYEVINKSVGILGCKSLNAKLKDLESQFCKWSFDELKAEYTRLFVKNVGKPYETAYLLKNTYGKNATLADVAGFYSAFGVKPKGEMPDFISCELEFMSLLCFKESYALANDELSKAEICSDAQKRFIRDHLSRWIKPFSLHLQKCSKITLYYASAEFTHTFIAYHAGRLAYINGLFNCFRNV